MDVNTSEQVPSGQKELASLAETGNDHLVAAEATEAIRQEDELSDKKRAVYILWDRTLAHFGAKTIKTLHTFTKNDRPSLSD